MKKMLSFLALAVFATAAQAITLNWATTSANPWINDSYSAALIYTSDASATLETAAQVAMGATVSGYDIVGTEWGVLEDATEGTIATTSGAYVAAISGTYFIVFTEGLNYAVTSVAATDAATAWIPVSGPIENSTYAGPVTVGDFVHGSVPEPTALALLALGVAGLALRRRA